MLYSILFTFKNSQLGDNFHRQPRNEGTLPLKSGKRWKNAGNGRLTFTIVSCERN